MHVTQERVYYLPRRGKGGRVTGCGALAGRAASGATTTAGGRGAWCHRVRCGGREGNKWSHHYCLRQWSLVDAEHLRYRQLNAWDAALQALEAANRFLSSAHQIVSHAGEDEQARTCTLSGIMGIGYKV